MKIILIAASALMLTFGAARAADGGAEAYPAPQPDSVVANQVLLDTGSETAPGYGPGTTAFTQDALLPVTGSEDEPQTANSLPAGAEDDPATVARHVALLRWTRAHTIRSPRG